MIGDMLSIDNSIGISLTETWLSDEICDAEVHIDGYDNFRADRLNRMRGGTSIYMTTDLNCKLVNTFSNSVVEIVIVTCKNLDTLSISVYWPPSTSNNEWKQGVDFIMNNVELSQAHGNYGRIVMSGDFNFPSLEWKNNRTKTDFYLNS